MKTKVLLFIMAFMLFISRLTFANVVLAEEACTVEEIDTKTDNVALEAAVTATSTDSSVIVDNLTDGQNRNGTYTGGGSFTFTFAVSQAISTVKIALNDKITVYKATGVDADLNTTYEEITFSATDRSVARVRIEFVSADGEILWDSGEIDTSTKAFTVTINAPDIYIAKSVNVYVIPATDQGGLTPIGEIYIYKQAGIHCWKLVSTTVEPSCTDNGKGTYSCDCGKTKTDIIRALDHNESSFLFDQGDSENHYTVCLNDNCPLGENAKIQEKSHEYDDECDAVCDTCGYERTIDGHGYSSKCDIKCNKCGDSRVPSENHSFLYSCSLECSKCGEPNPDIQEHKYDSACDSSCNYCQLEREVSSHIYSFKCDEACDVINCNYIRTDDEPHAYDHACDDTCNVCGAKREITGHIWDNACDAMCNTCPATRAVEHLYDNEYDGDCSICGNTRAVPDKNEEEALNEQAESELVSEESKINNVVSSEEEKVEQTLPEEPSPNESNVAIVGIACGVLGATDAIGFASWQIILKRKNS